jgi:hypothetical protein
MNNILEQMAERGGEDLRSAMEERQTEILMAIQKMADEREGDAPLKFKLSLALTADLDKSTVETAVSWSVKTTVKGVHAIERDNDGTPSLFGEEDA